MEGIDIRKLVNEEIAKYHAAHGGYKAPVSTLCKFIVSKVAQLGYQGMKEPVTQEEITLTAVYGGVGEDKSFAAATPLGQITITVTNPGVMGTFRPGAAYYVDLIPAE